MTTEHEATITMESSAISELENFPEISRKQLAWLDVQEGFQKWRIWLMLAYQDIKLRYRRSVLGPFWITLSMAITVYTMGYLYSHILHIEMQKYFPFLAAGMLGWSLISTMILETTDGLITADIFIKQIKLPYTLYIHRIIARNMIIFGHNLFVMVPIIIFYHEYAQVNLNTFLLLPGLAIIYLNGMFYGSILAMLGARYRDVAQIIKSLVQIVFFVTPVMWSPSVLSDKNRFIIDLNPFYAFLELIRAPLLGTAPTLINLIAVILVTLLGATLSTALFTRYRARLVYWL